MKDIGILFFVFSVVLLLSFSSCEQDVLDYSGEPFIEISSDSISFDTIMSTFGTTTKSFRIINRSMEPVILNSVGLGRDNESYFRLNVDGVPCRRIEDVEILGNDSIFVFVEATFPEMNVDSAYFQLDSVVIRSAMVQKRVKLLSWSQDVFLKSGQTKPGEVWTGVKPYLVMDSLEISFGEELIIKEGVKVLFHENAYLKVVGDLKVEGTAAQPVFFQGDRFDKTERPITVDYEHAPSQWAGIVVYPFSKATKIDHAVIKNGIFGIWAGSIGYPELPKIEISNSIIKNHSYAGIVSFGAEIDCSNTFFGDANCSVLLYTHGKYNFNHVTINNRFNEARDAGAVHISNFYVYDSVRYEGEFEALNFNNSIIHGNAEDELTLAFTEGSSFNVNLNHCALKLKAKTKLSHLNQQNVIFNNDSILINRGTHNAMYPDTLSPVIDAGSADLSANFPYDLLGNSRLTDDAPDMGAVELLQ